MKRSCRTAGILLALVLILSTLLATACSPMKSSAKEKETVLFIGDYEVSYEIYRYAALSLKASYDGGDESYWDTLTNKDETVQQLEEDALAMLKQYYAILSLLKDYGITPEDSYVEELIDGNVDAAMAEYENEKAFVEALREENMTYNVYRFLESCFVCQNELYYAMVRDGNIVKSDAYLRSFFRSEEMIRVKQILIDPAEYKSHEEALAVAQNVLALAQSGSDFDNLVNKYGDDLYMFKNTDGYYMMRGVRYHAFEEAAFALEEGEISDIVKTPAGYSIILRLKKEDSYLSEHFAELKNDYYDAVFSLAIEARAEELTVKATDAFDEYTLFTMQME